MQSLLALLSITRYNTLLRDSALPLIHYSKQTANRWVVNYTAYTTQPPQQRKRCTGCTLAGYHHHHHTLYDLYPSNQDIGIAHSFTCSFIGYGAGVSLNDAPCVVVLGVYATRNYLPVLAWERLILFFSGELCHPLIMIDMETANSFNYQHYGYINNREKKKDGTILQPLIF